VPKAKEKCNNLSTSGEDEKIPGDHRMPVPSPPTLFTAEQYLLEDYRHTLFPLTTTRLLVEKFSSQLRISFRAIRFDHKQGAPRRNEAFTCVGP
jgi:hypothetical protein